MSQIDQKIKTEVAWETSEIAKTDFYLPPVHKRIPHPYIENVDSLNLSPKAGHRSHVLGFTEQDEFERQKQLLLKKYTFPSSNPILKTPREMQEPCSFMARQLMLSKNTSMHAKQRSKKKLGKGNVDVNQVVKEAETLLQTAKIVLRESRRQAQETVVIHPTGASTHVQRCISPSYLNAASNVTSDLQSSNQLNNSPMALMLDSEPKPSKAKVTPDKSITQVAPMIRIFKAELAPVSPHRTKIQKAHPDSSTKVTTNEGWPNAIKDDDPDNTNMHEFENSPKQKGMIVSEKV